MGSAWPKLWEITAATSHGVWKDMTGSRGCWEMHLTNHIIAGFHLFEPEIKLKNYDFGDVLNCVKSLHQIQLEHRTHECGIPAMVYLLQLGPNLPEEWYNKIVAFRGELASRLAQDATSGFRSKEDAHSSISNILCVPPPFNGSEQLLGDNHVVLGDSGSMIFDFLGARPIGHLLSQMGTGWNNTEWHQVGGAEPATWMKFLRQRRAEAPHWSSRHDLMVDAVHMSRGPQHTAYFPGNQVLIIVDCGNAWSSGGSTKECTSLCPAWGAAIHPSTRVNRQKAWRQSTGITWPSW